MKDRKTMVLTLIAIVTLSLLVIGATFAYFGANNSASGSTTVTTQNETIGSVIVTNPTENLYMKLSSYDMQESYKGTSYYATEDSTVSHSKGKENNVIAKYSITGGEQSTVYNCSFNMSINKPSEIQKGDMTLKFTGIGAKVNGLSSVSVDLANADSTYQVTFSRVGNGIGNLVVGDITFNNTETEQNYLESKTLNTSVTLSGMECSIETTEEPDLFEGTLTPVVYDGDNWKIVSADDKKWYDYENQEWANAVILKSGLDKGVGDTVSVEGSNPDVLAMYVWIPRYEYRIEGEYYYNADNITNNEPVEIQINFISKETTKASNEYIIHPAFTLGGEELPGIWVGKFEISHTSLSSSTTYNNLECSTESCEKANEIRILPNNQSLKRNNVSNFYYGIKSMEQDENVFGINKEATDSHMMKNSEWGAVAYLTQSTYGKYGNDDFNGADKEVYINNSSSYYTGRSGGTYGGNVSTSTYGTYTYDGYLLDGNTKTTTRNMKKVASTTGNVTGIYDISGGSFEYVMGAYANSSNDVVIGSSGFTNIPNDKYIDKFKRGTGTIEELRLACNNGTCYGHAANETTKWYGDYANFLLGSNVPWLARGGSYSDGTSSGVFSAANTYGSAAQTISTRAVLTKKSSLTEEYKIYENGEVVYFDVETGLKCTNYNSENSKTGYNGIDNRTSSQNSCLKFYAFNDDGGNTLNLLLDHNTTATSLWNENGNNTTGPTEVIIELNNATKDWKGTVEPSNYTTGVEGRRYTINYAGLNARLITANDIAKITGNIGWYENISNSTVFYFDSNTMYKSSKCSADGVLDGCNYKWLYDRTSTNCNESGCLNNSDIETQGYWTATAVARKSVEQIHLDYCNGYTTYGIGDSARISRTCPNYSGHYGVRPVIEVNKVDLEYTSRSICTLADDSEVAAGEYGAKYNCKVDPNKPEYTFYLLDNNTDGTSDLIMDRNICEDGTQTEAGKKCLVAYNSSGDAAVEPIGPVTAMTYLNNATSSWENIDNLYLKYDDEGENFMNFVLNGKARLPYYSEVSAYDSKNKTNAYLYDYLNQTETIQTNAISEIYGYWTLSSVSDGRSSHLAWHVTSNGNIDNDYVDDGSNFGVRPVITVRL